MTIEIQRLFEEIHKVDNIETRFEENELWQIAYALDAKRKGQKVFELNLKPLSSGALPLFNKSFFPWKGLPYPKEHAQLGTLLALSEDKFCEELAQEMARYQQGTLAHNKKPFFSLYHQEGRHPLATIEEANALFFESLQLTPSDHYEFIDHELCLYTQRNSESSLYATGSGCKSGMGAFLCHDVGVVNYGPQIRPLGDCSSFGLAGKAHQGKVVKNSDTDTFSLSFTCPVATFLPRTPIASLQDSAYSGVWAEAEITGNLEQIRVHIRFEGNIDYSQLLLSFFGKGSRCAISGTQLLRPKSLDRYQGPPQELYFMGETAAIKLTPHEGISSMEVVPLAGDEGFWQSDFLATFSLNVSEASFTLTTLKKNG